MLLALQQNMLLGDAPTLVEVPDVVGQSQASATAELEGVLFVVAVNTAYSSTVPVGDVISQSPLAGVEAAEGSTVTITVSAGEAPVVDDSQPSGGFFFSYDRTRIQRARRKRELDEMEAQQKAIKDEQDREIASLLREQEAKDAEREDLERIQAIADNYVKTPNTEPIPAPVRAAVYNAYEQRTKNALEQMQRVIEQMYEEEELAVIAALLMSDD